MPDIISFDEALKRTDKQKRAVLLGNGFSIHHFSYKTLLEKSGLKEGDPLHALFSLLKTCDFESVIKALEDASLVEQAYKNDEQSKIFSGDADKLRQALVNAVRTIHPTHRDKIADVIPSCIQFLKSFANIFTLNYDLLLYWVILEDRHSFQDGFGLGDEENGFKGPFTPLALCNVYNLHGGLHLFRTEIGEVEKRLMGANGIIDAISETITKAKRLPIYVAEASSSAKLAHINSSPYLRRCLERLSASTGAFFIFGHSANPNDAHVYDALFNCNIDHLYFCIHQPTARLNIIDGELARYKKQNTSRIDYSFVDSETAHVWDRKLKS
jgi:Domain of unknown function (DUF4917)